MGQSGSWGSWCLSPTVYERKAGYTLDRSPAHPRATQTGKTTNVERPIDLTVMFLDCGRKPENPERTHTYMGRTCSLHAERPHAWSRTQDLLAAMQQRYQLRAAPHN
ncbi:hypothetical protein CHARACLAT_008791 [Characodon lateralis]|uniref:Uncharacterized protein n=1 Tax=Characodon lateralis TaxID=208331 RepID=A0ABU7E879_9TELE|nr:hypothetical protein [Characodon lateralis]